MASVSVVSSADGAESLADTGAVLAKLSNSLIGWSEFGKMIPPPVLPSGA